MKKLGLFIFTLILLGGCGNTGNGYLIGVLDRKPFYQEDPYGMQFIPQGSYNMGPGDQDVPFSQTTQSKTVSLAAFYMDETEITNNEYRQFVEWVRDSIARLMLAQGGLEDYWYTDTKDGDPIDPPILNWNLEINWAGEEEKGLLQSLYIPEQERFYRRKEIDARQLMFEYYWVDLRMAALKQNRWDFKTKAFGNGIPNRTAFVKKGVTNIYPDTLAWIHDFTYSYNEPMTNMYFWHPAYDNYPVVGVNWIQAKAFCIWRTMLLNNYLAQQGESFYNEYRLPTESEWEYASRGGLDLNAYPWGGPYTRHQNGCFLANFKPLRGIYVDDGGLQSLVVGHYDPNDYGLYDMAGNVAEWTNNAFDESAYNFAHDMNMDYQYDANENDMIAKKRKVIRGGSWKDIAYYIQCGSRTYEYQDTAKCYIGFRCVQTYLGRDKNDSQASSKVYN